MLLQNTSVENLASISCLFKVLEKLIGSQSFIGAIGTAITLRSANMLSVLLLSI